MTEKPNDDLETPPWLFDRLNRVFRFALDAAANAENHLCDQWLGPGHDPAVQMLDDALTVPWSYWTSGAIFCNPPYSDPGPFMAQAQEAGQRTTVVCLVKKDESTRWWHQHIRLAGAEVYTPWQRIKFYRGGTEDGRRYVYFCDHRVRAVASTATGAAASGGGCGALLSRTQAAMTWYPYTQRSTRRPEGGSDHWMVFRDDATGHYLVRAMPAFPWPQRETGYPTVAEAWTAFAQAYPGATGQTALFAAPPETPRPVQGTLELP